MRCNWRAATCLLYYQAPARLIIDLLTTSAQQRPVSEDLRTRLKAYVEQVHTPEAQVFGAQYEFEYYRRFVICVKARIQRTLERTGHRPSGVHLPIMPFTLAHSTGEAGAGAVSLRLRSRNFFKISRLLRASLAANARHAHCAHVDRSADSAGAHFRTASAHAGYKAACAGACKRRCRRPSATRWLRQLPSGHVGGNTLACWKRSAS